jgi:hypothetical protein
MANLNGTGAKHPRRVQIDMPLVTEGLLRLARGALLAAETLNDTVPQSRDRPEAAPRPTQEEWMERYGPNGWDPLASAAVQFAARLAIRDAEDRRRRVNGGPPCRH